MSRTPYRTGIPVAAVMADNAWVARRVLAVLIAASSLAAGVWLHDYEETRTRTIRVEAGAPSSFGSGRNRVYENAAVERQEHPSWADPAAIFVVAAGLGTAGVLLFARPS